MGNFICMKPKLAVMKMFQAFWRPAATLLYTNTPCIRRKKKEMELFDHLPPRVPP